jgi:hypothetical protein
MVTTLNITLDDDVADDLRRVKNELDITWPEFVKAAGRCLQEREDDPARAARDPPTDDSTASPAADPSTATDDHSGDVSAVTDAHREHLREELAGSGERLETRVDAILLMYAHLRKDGTAEKSDFLALVDPNTVGYDSRKSVWSNTVKGKDTLSALPGVKKPPTGRSEWRYRP